MAPKAPAPLGVPGAWLDDRSLPFHVSCSAVAGSLPGLHVQPPAPPCRTCGDPTAHVLQLPRNWPEKARSCSSVIHVFACFRSGCAEGEWQALRRKATPGGDEAIETGGGNVSELRDSPFQRGEEEEEEELDELGGMLERVILGGRECDEREEQKGKKQRQEARRRRTTKRDKEKEGHQGQGAHPASGPFLPPFELDHVHEGAVPFFLRPGGQGQGEEAVRAAEQQGLTVVGNADSDSDWAGEAYERMPSEWRFHKRLAQRPDQVVRMSSFLSVKGLSEEGVQHGRFGIGTCSMCGGDRVACFQVMAPILSAFMEAYDGRETESWVPFDDLLECDLVTATVYACQPDCSPPDSDHLPEPVILEREESTPSK